MAKAKPHAFLNSIFGVLGKRDQTVGKTPALGLTMAKGLKHTILGIKTKKTAKASPLQLERRALWSASDCIFKDLCPGHRTLLTDRMNEYNATHTNQYNDIYHFHMHISLTPMPRGCNDWVENFDGFYYERSTIISFSDNFNGPEWSQTWVTEWTEGFNS